MRVFLRERAHALEEQMDAENCDPSLLGRTYAQFDTINRLLSGWTWLYRTRLRPVLATGATRVLDLGCGGGDVLRHLAALAAREGLVVQFVGVDPDARAIAFAQAQPTPRNITFCQADAHTLATAGETFDVVLSNHVLHHLSSADIPAFCQDCQRLARTRVIHSDLRREDLAYALFPLVSLSFRRSLILSDGLRSIRRAFTPAELQALAPPGWNAAPVALFRLLLSWDSCGS